jgi:hypothetical protein
MTDEQMIEVIKKSSELVAREYLSNGTSMNDQVIQISEEMGLNEEIIRRICEQANQAVYLALFNNPETNRKDIKFCMAEPEEIIKILTERESSMQDYDIAPTDYKSGLDVASDKAPSVNMEEIINASIPQIKVAALAIGRRDIGVYQGFLSNLEGLRSEEMRNIEKLAERVRRDTTIMVSNNESIADIAKLACRYVKSKGLSFDKIASVYNEIHDELIASGYKVNDEFTKISSAPLRMDSPVFFPSFEIALGFEKIAALTEMIARASETLSAYKEITEKVELHLV